MRRAQPMPGLAGTSHRFVWSAPMATLAFGRRRRLFRRSRRISRGSSLKERFALRWGRFGSFLGPVDPFGFSWLVAFSLRKPRLNHVAFPWILSSESRLSMGYTDKSAKIF